jgi:ABC-type dipeptide/oligopeptide/nickel transport system permease subunit
MRYRVALPRSVSGRVGLVLLVAMVAVAVFGPLVAPHSPDATIGSPYDPPGTNGLLGTDFLGRDVLSRVLSGGRSVLLYALIATVAAYAGGLLIGLAAGHMRSWLDPVLMRSVDVLLAFPALVFILLITTGLGKGIWPAVLATAVIQLPAIARIIRTATLEQSVRSYVEAAVARGEGSLAILRREILPNITRPISADIGLRFTWSVLLIASDPQPIGA